MRFPLVACLVLAAACTDPYPSGEAFDDAKVLCACPRGFGVEAEANDGGTTCDCAAATGQEPCSPGDDSPCGLDETCRSGGGTSGACVCACDDTWGCDAGCACDPECASAELQCRAGGDCDADACEVCADGRCVPGCGAGRACDGAGSCVAGACDGPADCYPWGFCDAGARCADLATLAACTATATSAPGPVADGPTLFGAEQVDLRPGDDAAWCTKEPASCTNNGNVCAWRLSWYDPQDDVGVTQPTLYSNVRFLRPSDGGATLSYNVIEILPGSFVIEACFSEDSLPVRGGAWVQDAAGHRSNAVCLEGQAP